ncbi:hypothetical protein MPSEU_000977000 [Mayamaea pseudoterrestris]|nr:hypothetical protein MPSEU_000977000 [Mayamaea pseudoterrestris]
MYLRSTFSRCMTALSSASDAADHPVPMQDKSLQISPIKYHWTRKNLSIALPALIGMMIDPLLSLIDTFYTGRVGSTELAALGACTSIFHLAFNAFRATTAATTSLVANALALNSNDDSNNGINATDFTKSSGPQSILANDDAQTVVALSLKFGSYMGLAVLVALLAGGNAALHHMGIPKTSLLHKPAADYLFTRCWVAPVVLFMGVAEGAFRGYGNTMVPLTASIVAAGINVVLDPLIMFPPINMGVQGAAAATAVAQIGAALVYAYYLLRRNMLPRKSAVLKKRNPTAENVAAAKKTKEQARGVVKSILGANLSMIMKQGSLLFGWAYATARATRLGATQVAAHQVALSVWLVFAFILDGTAVSAQVLMSRAYAIKDKPQVKSLTKYMIGFALLQGLISMLVVDGLDLLVPRLFTSDKAIQAHLHHVMPHLAWQQVIVSLTLVIESLAAGANQFSILAIGTTFSTVLALWQMSRQASIDGIWFLGIGTLFVGRLLTACVAVTRALWIMKKTDDRQIQKS